MKKDCSKTVNLIKEWNRMCSEIGTRCSRCPLSCNNNGTNLTCFDYIKQYPGKVAEIVQTWSDARRQKTYVEDFFEKFPNAPKKWGIGTPEAAWCNVYGNGSDDCPASVHRDCAKCWNQIMEDKPNEGKEDL